VNILRLLAEVLAERAQERERLGAEECEVGTFARGFQFGYAEGMRFAADALTETLGYEPARPDLRIVP
jgi:hypothetical protein